MVSQAKIDLAVLLKLFQHAEANGEAETSLEICNLFGVAIPLHRVVAALEGLESRGEVVRKYDRFHDDEGLWHIGRDGIQTVEKALRVPSSFIARLQLNGDQWLESDEAAGASLSKLKRYHPQSPAQIFSNDADVASSAAAVQPIQITNNFTPSNTVNVKPATPTEQRNRSGWWNFGAAIAIGIATIFVTLWVAGKL